MEYEPCSIMFFFQSLESHVNFGTQWVPPKNPQQVTLPGMIEEPGAWRKFSQAKAGIFVEPDLLWAGSLINTCI